MSIKTCTRSSQELCMCTWPIDEVSLSRSCMHMTIETFTQSLGNHYARYNPTRLQTHASSKLKRVFGFYHEFSALQSDKQCTIWKLLLWWSSKGLHHNSTVWNMFQQVRYSELRRDLYNAHRSLCEGQSARWHSFHWAILMNFALRTKEYFSTLLYLPAINAHCQFWTGFRLLVHVLQARAWNSLCEKLFYSTRMFRITT